MPKPCDACHVSSAVVYCQTDAAYLCVSCDGKVHGDLPPGRGVVDFPAYLRAIRDLNIPDATISVELEYSPEPSRIVEWVREAYESTSRLMREAGLRA